MVKNAAGQLEGVEAVIDKDMVSALLAKQLNADGLIILTDGGGIFENFGKENAREMCAETGETYESTFRTMVEDIFRGPVAKREDTEYRQLKITQRQYPYDNDHTPNVIPLQDAEGNDVTSDMTLSRGAKIAPVVTPSFYFMPDGGFGIKLEVSLRHGIKVMSNPEASGGGGGGVLYSMDEDEPAAASHKRARDDDETGEAKRIRVE